MPYWKWIAFGVWILMFGFTFAFVGTSVGESEMGAAVKGGILFGIIVLLAGVGLYRLLKIVPGQPKEETEHL
jgi:hypothetical protein